MRTITVCVAVALAGAFLFGCQNGNKRDLPPPPSPVVVNVSIADPDTYKDAEAVRRVVVAQPMGVVLSGSSIGSGFSNESGESVPTLVSPPKSEVMQYMVAKSFHDMGFNVSSGQSLRSERAEDVQAELARSRADYLALPTVTELEITTARGTEAPAFATLVMDVAVFGSDGKALTTVPVVISGAWRSHGEPGADDLKRYVEDLLQQASSQITWDPKLREALGLTISGVK